MEHRLFRVYFETSALNAVRERMSIEDAISTKAHLNVKGKGWYISPVVLWEILATRSEEEREGLIYFAQHLCEADLFPSPEEILVNYIGLGCPAVEKEHEFISRGTFSRPWRDICAIKEKTLTYSADDHALLTRVMRDLGEQFHQFYKNQHVDVRKHAGSSEMQVSVIGLMKHHNSVSRKIFDDSESLRVASLVGFYLLIFLCAEVSIDKGPVRRFWERLGIKEMDERIEYAFSKLKPLFVRGPLLAMASMNVIQSTARANRGMVFDCLHSIYAIYADMFLSNDEHFRQFREHAVREHKLSLPIRMLDEVRFTATPRETFVRTSFVDGG